MKRAVVILVLVLSLFAVSVAGEDICMNKDSADSSWAKFTFDGKDEKLIRSPRIFTRLKSLYDGPMNDNSQKRYCTTEEAINNENCYFDHDLDSLESLEFDLRKLDQSVPMHDSELWSDSGSNLDTGEKTNFLVTWIYALEEQEEVQFHINYDEDLAFYLGDNCGETVDVVNCEPRLHVWESGPSEEEFSLRLTKGWNVIIMIVDNAEGEHFVRYHNEQTNLLSGNDNLLMYSDPELAQPDRPCTTTEVIGSDGEPTGDSYIGTCERNQCAYREECVNEGVITSHYVCSDDDNIYYCNTDGALTPDEEFFCIPGVGWQVNACEEGKERIVSYNDDSEPRREGSACCNTGQCADGANCFDKGGVSWSGEDRSICLENNNWAVCDEDGKTTTIEEQAYICKDDDWEILQPEVDCKNNEADTNEDGKSGCEDPTCLGRRCTDGGGVCGRDTESLLGDSEVLPNLNRVDIGDVLSNFRTGRTIGIQWQNLLPTQCIEPSTLCSDKKDNDADGKTDCLDADCHGSSQCEFGKELTCNDGFDNDGDTQFVTAPRAPEEQEAQPLRIITIDDAPEEQEARPLRTDAIAIDALTGMAVATENTKPGFWERTKLFIKNMFSRERAIAGQAERQVCGPNTKIVSTRDSQTGQIFIVCRCLEGFEDEDDNKVNGCEIRVPNLEGLEERAQQAEEQQRRQREEAEEEQGQNLGVRHCDNNDDCLPNEVCSLEDFICKVGECARNSDCEEEEICTRNNNCITQAQLQLEDVRDVVEDFVPEEDLEIQQGDPQEDEELIKVNIDQLPIQVNVKHGTDCQDSDCIRKQGPSGICCITDSHCGSGAMCSGNSCIESNCLVGSGDNDKDGLEDNEDPDCYFKQCTDETGRNAKQWQEGECKAIALAQQAQGDVGVQVEVDTGKSILEYYSENTVIVKEEGVCNNLCRQQGKLCVYGNGVPPGGKGNMCEIVSTECWCLELP